ncbi:MAG TPA: hypothetical protein VJJ75_03190, partial [Candidatus Nanoarchaeia archaeon]|nr:hypothetical protein [Candidatus Nanoarchaeia archaeon]
LRREGLFMPSPAIFMPYRSHVIRAAAGYVRLYDGTGKRLARDAANEVAKPLTEDCWAWLYAKFAEQQGKIFITYNRIKSLDAVEEVTEVLQLKKNIRDDSLVDLVFNKQGMPVRNSREQEFDAENNIYFRLPVDGSVAWFRAVADWAGLYCVRDRQYSYSAPGVFACAAGAQKFSGRSSKRDKVYDNLQTLGGRLK